MEGGGGRADGGLAVGLRGGDEVVVMVPELLVGLGVGVELLLMLVVVLLLLGVKLELWSEEMMLKL